MNYTIGYQKVYYPSWLVFDIMSVKIKIKKSEINPGQGKSYQFNDEKIIVCNVDGEYFAIEDRCSHDNAELVSESTTFFDGCQIQCPRHGARFNVKTGQPTRMPAVAPIKSYKINILNQDEFEVEE